MRRLFIYTTALLLALTATWRLLRKRRTPLNSRGAMKRISAANGATVKAIKSGRLPTPRPRWPLVKQALMDAENFWVMNKKDDAVKMSKEAIAKVSAVEAALSAATPNQEAAFAAVKEVGAMHGLPHGLPRPERGQDLFAQAGNYLNSQIPTPRRFSRAPLATSKSFRRSRFLVTGQPQA